MGKLCCQLKRFSCVQVLAGDGWAVRDQRVDPEGAAQFHLLGFIDGPHECLPTGDWTRCTYPGCSRRISIDGPATSAANGSQPFAASQWQYAP